MKTFSVVFCFVLIYFFSGFTKADVSSQTKVDSETLLERHNFYRSKLGIPDLQWSMELEEYAQKWANHLSKTCDMKHSRGTFGENIYWTSGNASETEIVDYWASEEKYFNHRNRVYKKNIGSKSGHYSQIIWKNTTHMGGAKAECRHGGEIWVCSYNPHGNMIGQKAY